jgi:hypothetical protein
MRVQRRWNIINELSFGSNVTKLFTTGPGRFATLFFITKLVVNASWVTRSTQETRLHPLLYVFFCVYRTEWRRLSMRAVSYMDQPVRFISVDRSHHFHQLIPTSATHTHIPNPQRAEAFNFFIRRYTRISRFVVLNTYLRETRLEFDRVIFRSPFKVSTWFW